MKILIVDYHSSATRDISMILKEQGHEVTSWNFSNHCWAFGEEKSRNQFLNKISLSEFKFDIGKEFWNHHSSELEKYDCYITGHTPCLSLLFSLSNKPVIVCITTRYEHPFTGNSENWKRFNDYLIEGYSSGRLKFVSNNFYDAKYFEHYTGILPKTIQSLCHYHEGLWNKKQNQFVLYSKLHTSSNDIIDLKSRGRYRWEDWYSYAGVYCIPYQVSTMSLFEFSAAGMPVIYPDIDETLYLRRKFPQNVLSELSWRTVSEEYSNNSFKTMKSFNDLPSPNDVEDELSVRYWLSYSDCYTPWMSNVIKNNSNITFNDKKAIFSAGWKDVISRI